MEDDQNPLDMNVFTVYRGLSVPLITLISVTVLCLCFFTQGCTVSEKAHLVRFRYTRYLGGAVVTNDFLWFAYRAPGE